MTSKFLLDVGIPVNDENWHEVMEASNHLAAYVGGVLTDAGLGFGIRDMYIEGFDNRESAVTARDRIISRVHELFSSIALDADQYSESGYCIVTTEEELFGNDES